MPPVLVDRGHRFEAWTNPNATTFARKFDLSRWVGYTIAHKYGAISDGKLDLPADFPKMAQLFHVDKADHANDVASVIRVLRGTIPITHYVTKRLDDRWSSSGDTLEVQLEGMDYFLDRALVPNFDAPANPTKEPDWTYGAPSILTLTDFEGAGQNNLVFWVWTTTGATGTFTLTIGGETTAAVDAAAGDDGTLQTAIESLSNIVDVVVSGDGTEENPWVVEVISPAATDFTLVFNGGGLSGGTGAVSKQVVGALPQPAPWTVSFHPTLGLQHGSYEAFEISTEQAHGGTHSLKVNTRAPAAPGDFGGAQQIVTVTGGRTYRAEVWVYPTATGPFRFVIRTFDETWIASTEATLTANTWTLMSLTFTAFEHIDKVIFRIATISNADEPAWYVDDALLAPGAPEDTYGKMMGDVFTAVQAAGYLTWVTKMWTDTHDANGNVWDQDRQWVIRHRQSLLQLVEYADRWNYESSGIYWSVANSRFEWGLFNPNAGMTDRLGTGVAVIGKAISQTGTIAKAIPDASSFYAEGDDGYWGEASDADLVTAYGPLQKSYFNSQSLEEPGQTELATRMVTDAAKRTAGLVTRISASPIRPWQHFVPGDRNIMVNLAPKRAREYLRCMAIVATKGRDDAAPVYEAHWDAVVFQGEAAHLETTRRLVRAFQSQRPATAEGASVAPVGGPGSGPIAIYSLPGQAFVEVGRLRYYFPFGGTMTWATVSANVAPTGADLIVDVNVSGVSIYGDPSSRPTIPVGLNVSALSIFNIVVPEFGYVTVDVDQVGSTLPGGDVTIQIGGPAPGGWLVT